jgi:hypothetical protein
VKVDHGVVQVPVQLQVQVDRRGVESMACKPRATQVCVRLGSVAPIGIQCDFERVGTSSDR